MVKHLYIYDPNFLIFYHSNYVNKIDNALNRLIPNYFFNLYKYLSHFYFTKDVTLFHKILNLQDYYHFKIQNKENIYYFFGNTFIVIFLVNNLVISHLQFTVNHIYDFNIYYYIFIYDSNLKDYLHLNNFFRNNIYFYSNFVDHF